MSIVDNFPDIKPSLNLDFANTKSLDPRVDFDRSSTATYYDGQTFAKAEENLLKYSQEFDNAYWDKQSGLSVSADSETAPDGTTTADGLVENTGTSGHFIQTGEDFTITSGVKYVYSVFAKQASGNRHLQIRVTGKGTPTEFANFDLVNGVVGNTTGSNFVSANITAVTNSYLRCDLIAEGDGSSVAEYSLILITDPAAGDTESYTGDGVSGLFIWGAQLEERSQVTAYTPTTDQPITNYIPVLQTASSDEPRFDHDPLTGESKGLLIEEQRTNLVPRSYASSGPYIESPAGDNLARVLTESNSTTLHRVGSPTFSVSVGEPIAVSAFIKNVHGDRNVLFNTTATTGSYLNFNPRTGTVNSSSGASSISIQDVGQGWWRVSYIGTGRNNNNRFYVQLNKNTTAGDQSYLGDGFSSIAFYGLQVEEGSFPSSYIKTEGSQVTRVADSASISGSNFSEWYRQDEGTLFIDSIVGFDNFSALSTLQTGPTSANERISVFRTNATTLESAVTAFGNIQAFQFENVISNEGIAKAAIGFKKNDVNSSFNGAIENDDTNALMPTGINTLKIGGFTSGSELNGTVKRLTYYPKRLPNAVLQALTKD